MSGSYPVLVVTPQADVVPPQSHFVPTQTHITWQPRQNLLQPSGAPQLQVGCRCHKIIVSPAGHFENL